MDPTLRTLALLKRPALFRILLSPVLVIAAAAFLSYKFDSVFKASLCSNKVATSPSSTKLKMVGPSLDVAYNKKRFLEAFPVIVEELVQTLKAESMPEEVVEWYRRVRSSSSHFSFVWLTREQYAAELGI